MLTAQNITGYERHGFAIVRQAISPETLKKLQLQSDQWVEQTRGLTQSNEMFDLQAEHCADAPRVNRVNHPVAHSALCWEVARSNAVLDCVAALLGEHVRFHHSKLNMKSAAGGAAIGWHQDFPFFPHCNFDLLACGIALDDATLHNGCLTVIPGTHKGPLLNHRQADGHFMGQITPPDVQKIDESKAVPVELKAGDMSIHHACTIHGSTPNLSTHNRRLLIFQYAAADAFPFEPSRTVNGYNGTIVRGLPPTHARMAGAMTLPLRGNNQQARSIFSVQQTGVAQQQMMM